MLIRELLEGVNEYSVCASQREPEMKAVEAYVKKVMDPTYTPGKAALELEYKESEIHTKSEIPFKQKILNDPRQ